MSLIAELKRLKVGWWGRWWWGGGGVVVVAAVAAVVVVVRVAGGDGGGGGGFCSRSRSRHCRRDRGVVEDPTTNRQLNVFLTTTACVRTVL
jgi:hypothetical protein